MMKELIEQIKKEREDLMTVNYELSKSAVYEIIDISEKLNISVDEVIELSIRILDKKVYEK